MNKNFLRRNVPYSMRPQIYTQTSRKWTSLCCREAGERFIGKRAGDDGKWKEKKRGSRLFSLPIVHRAHTIFFLFISIFIRLFSGSLCGGESLRMFHYL